MKVDDIIDAINSYNDRFGYDTKPTITIGYKNWHKLLKECSDQVVGFDIQFALKNNCMLCAGCKVIWAYALTDEILTSI